MARLVVKLSMPPTIVLRRRRKLPTYAKDVFGIGALRHQLGYENIGGERERSFHRDVRDYIANYTTEDGLSGKCLKKWRSQPHKKHLIVMTKNFLDRDGNGSLYWPHDVESLYYGVLQYSNHKLEIRTLCAQFFFGLNQQPPARNARAKSKSAYRRAASRGVSSPGNETGSSFPLREPVVTSDLDLTNFPPPPSFSAPANRVSRAVPRALFERSKTSQLETRSVLPSPRSLTAEGPSRIQRHQDPDSDYVPGPSTRVQGQHNSLSRGRSSSKQVSSHHGVRASTLGFQPDSTTSSRVPQDSLRQRRDREELNIMSTIESDISQASPTPRRGAPVARMGPPNVGGFVKPNIPSRASSILPEDDRRRNGSIFPDPRTPLMQSSQGRPSFSHIGGNLVPSRITSMNSQPSPRNASAPLDYVYRLQVKVSPGIIERWRMNGSFEDKSLEAVVAEMKSHFKLDGNYDVLYAKLHTPNSTVYDSVYLYDEGDYQDMKVVFNDRITNILNQSSETPIGRRVFGLQLELGSSDKPAGEEAAT